MSEEKEFVSLYLPKTLAKQVKGLESGAAQEEIIEKFFEQSKTDMQSNLDDLEERVIQYKGLMIKTKQAFKDAKETQLKESYDLWEKFEDELPSVQEKTDRLVKKLKPVERQLSEINRLIENINIYKLENAIELINKINHMTPETKDIFKFLLEKYK